MAKIHFKNLANNFLDYTLTLGPGRAPSDVLVVYIHGFASDQSGEKVQFLRDSFNKTGVAFVAFDHRGHGKSSGSMKELTVTRNLEDLGLIINHTGGGFSKILLIGSSMGGQTAAWYAARNPERITANLLIAPAFHFFQNRLRELGPAGVAQIKKDGYYTLKNGWVEVTVGLDLFEDAPHYPVEKLLRDYRTATLILHGTDDDAVPIEDSVAFTRKTVARPSDLLVIGGGDHRLTEHKNKLFQSMEQFCQSIGVFPAIFP